MDVDQVVDGHAAIHERLHLVLAVFLGVGADAGPVVGHLVHHLAVGVREVGVVLEKITVPVDVGHHQLLIDGVVGAHQVGVARIVVDHHLVDLRQPVVVALAQLLVGHAERPVRIARREAAVGGDLVEIVGVDDLEDGLVEIQAVLARIALDLVLESAQVGRQVGVVRRLHGVTRKTGRGKAGRATRTRQQLRRRSASAVRVPSRSAAGAQELLDRSRGWPRGRGSGCRRRSCARRASRGCTRRTRREP